MALQIKTKRVEPAEFRPELQPLDQLPGELKMNKIARTSLTVLAISLVAGLIYIGSKRLTVVHLAHAQVTAIPFTLEMEIVDVSAGSPQVFNRKTVARRSDGSTAVKQSKKIGTILTVTFMDGRKLSLSDLIQSRMSWRAAESQVAVLKQLLSNPPANCAHPIQRYKGNQVIAGEAVAVLEYDVGQGDRRRVTSFKAPRLGCETLGYIVDYVHEDGTVTKVTEGRLIQLTLGEPDPALFNNGAGYTELRPSDFLRAQLGKLGVTGLNPETDPEIQELDKEYQEHGGAASP